MTCQRYQVLHQRQVKAVFLFLQCTNMCTHAQVMTTWSCPGAPGHCIALAYAMHGDSNKQETVFGLLSAVDKVVEETDHGLLCPSCCLT